ncbi:hypothetical protein Pyn_39897 [Prunus yedoensis var. nudiflora]|uniref:Signal recognition particle subunit SRP68 n=1 Tax=Prunus yedoensis var. nudiflora TaxID=2094558 RepID=A0A314YLJ5_PRUYE|nr:hypothetical protein Pyn_39897 [Prunus yedoensis var. nudiflora]
MLHASDLVFSLQLKVKESIEQSFSYYAGDDGSVDKQADGAYIFRPNGTYPIQSKGQVHLTVLRGPLLDEVHQRINSWIYQVTRVYKEKEHAEIEFTVGPIPIGDGIGKEIVTKITTSMETNKTFYTDSNGRDFIERIRDYRKDWDLQVNQPVAGNYYPINLGIYTKDNNTEMSVLVDRSVGGSSIVDGQLELMVHRRLVHDDDRGVDEPLNETVCIQDVCKGLTIMGKYYLRLDPLGEGAKWRRSFGQEIYSPFLLAFTEQEGDNWTSSHVTTFSWMDPSYVLPDNVAIITLQELEDGKLLFRLAHLYEIEEDKDLSVMASVELKKVFADKKINKVAEMSLSANQERAEMEKKRLVWKVEGSSEEEAAAKVMREGLLIQQSWWWILLQWKFEHSSSTSIPSIRPLTAPKARDHTQTSTSHRERALRGSRRRNQSNYNTRYITLSKVGFLGNRTSSFRCEIHSANQLICVILLQTRPFEMGKDTQASSAMEIDNLKSNSSDQIAPKFSINVLQLLKSAQMQHGLRHGDYTRYRRYCTARLRRLYKSLKFTHGRGKYTRRAITESAVTEVRFLHVVLYTAERAWSHAMEKRQVLDGPNARQRIYLIGRLRKAVKWATLFAQLCAIKGDSRTSLEAEAYASFMKGSLLFEQDQNWDTALMNFKSARAVYEELAKYGDLESQVLCRERVEELEPSIRYCLHKVGESNLQASELLQIGEMEGPALDLFKAKLEAVMAEARSQQAASMTEFHWLGHRFPISNPKTRVSILKAQELEKDVLGSSANSLPAEKKLGIFDKIFTAYHEARSCIRNDLDDLNGLDKAVSAVLGQRTLSATNC